MFFSVAIAGHKLGHLDIFSEYFILNLAMGVVSIVMMELTELADEKEQEQEENPSTQDEDPKEEEEESKDKPQQRRSLRKRKATVTFADNIDEQEEKDKATKLD